MLTAAYLPRSWDNFSPNRSVHTPSSVFTHFPSPSLRPFYRQQSAVQTTDTLLFPAASPALRKIPRAPPHVCGGDFHSAPDVLQQSQLPFLVIFFSFFFCLALLVRLLPARLSSSLLRSKDMLRALYVFPLALCNFLRAANIRELLRQEKVNRAVGKMGNKGEGGGSDGGRGRGNG